MSYLKLMCLIAFLTTLQAHSSVINILFPETKYSLGDCITPMNPSYTWYGVSVKVGDIVYSKNLKQFTYYLIFSDGSRSGFFSIKAIEQNTTESSRCNF